MYSKNTSKNSSFNIDFSVKDNCVSITWFQHPEGHYYPQKRFDYMSIEEFKTLYNLMTKVNTIINKRSAINAHLDKEKGVI